MKLLRSLLVCSLLAACTAVAVQAFLLVRVNTRNSATLPAAVDRHATEARNALVGQVAAARQDLARQIEGARKDLLSRADKQLNDLRQDVLREVAETRKAADQRTGETLARVDAAIQLLTPAVEGATKLEASVTKLSDNYAALPSQVAQELRPTLNALQPEFTCHKLDGSGYGGCWHSRITALMGEAANVGGVFTQKFPSLAKSVTGIASDAHGWTEKYVQPHPLTLGQKFKAAGQIVIGLGTAGLRGGAF